MINRNAKNAKRLMIALNRVVVKLSQDLQIDLHDRNYVLRRLQQEGVKFLTVTLPIFAKFAIHCIEVGSIDRDYTGITAFGWNRRSPRFMRGLLIGALSGCPTSLFRIRQFCEYFYKTAFSFTNSELSAAKEKYLATDSSLEDAELDLETVRVCRKIFFNVFPEIARANPVDIFRSSSTRDGPGAFAGSEKTRRQHDCSYEQFKRLPADTIGLARRDFRPFSGYFRAYPASDEAALLVNEDKVCDLRFVPKDSRGPRTISKEPYFLIKAQMAFMDYITSRLESATRGRINFVDQTVNQKISEAASVDRSKATLDLREASDRVRRLLVKLIFQHAPGVTWFLNHATSTHVRLDNFSAPKRINKLANMGSGLCFPILALIVYLAAVAGIVRKRGIPYKEAALMVYVYGDDIACPSDCYEAVIFGLESVGLLVNRGKSFVKGHFRESCGADYYHGTSVGPVRLKLSNEGLESVDHYRNGYVPILSDGGILQLERHCRELVANGLLKTASYYHSLLEKKLGPLPMVSNESPYLGKTTLGHFVNNVSSGYLPITEKVLTPAVCGRKALGKAFRSRHGLGEDFERVPLRRKVTLKNVEVLNPATVYMYGLERDPRELLRIGGGVYDPSLPFLTFMSTFSFLSTNLVDVGNKVEINR